METLFRKGRCFLERYDKGMGQKKSHALFLLRLSVSGVSEALQCLFRFTLSDFAFPSIL